MSNPTPANLEEAIRQSGESWLIDWFAPPEKALEHLSQTIDAVRQTAQMRLGRNAPNITEATLLHEYIRNPARVRGFFQTLGGSRTPEMLLMVWRIIQGMEIKSVEFTYLRQDSFKMRIVLESPYGEEDTPYETSQIQDLSLLRHIGIMEISGRPVLDGFYPLRVK
jgi:hypothetical protein